MSAKRGHIYRVRIPDVEGERTALVVSSDVVNDVLNPVVVQVTSSARIRVLPTSVPLRAGDGGLTDNSYALCHELHTIDGEQFDRDPLGPMLSARKIVQVEQALHWVLDLEIAA